MFWSWITWTHYSCKCQKHWTNLLLRQRQTTKVIQKRTQQNCPSNQLYHLECQAWAGLGVWPTTPRQYLIPIAFPSFHIGWVLSWITLFSTLLYILVFVFMFEYCILCSPALNRASVRFVSWAYLYSLFFLQSYILYLYCLNKGWYHTQLDIWL